MLKITIEAANLDELKEQISDLAENLLNPTESNFASGTTAAITQPASPLNENNTADVTTAAKSARKPRASKNKGADAPENVSGASDEKFPAGASASPNGPSVDQSAASTAPATPATNPFAGAPTATPHLVGANVRDQLATAINAFLDNPNGGMDKALAILGKYGAKKMSDVMDAQIPAVIAELNGAQPQANSIFS